MNPSRTAVNRLADSLSPYLLQHAENPVHWWPWGDAAFEEATRTNKPVFLSVGYSTCHWCHVMAHESFESPEVARALNDVFVCVKVDREERPDVDALYMTVCQMATGRGGWPLTVLLLPDRRPFYVATYLPPHGRAGRPGVVDLAQAIGEAWQNRREEIGRYADQLTNLAVQRYAPVEVTGAALDENLFNDALKTFQLRFDAEFGGYGSAPKFPSPHNGLFLLRQYRRTGDANVLHLVAHTLRAMQLGGIHDHVGGGFHRYSTDRFWRLPHFEKMLYDQAMLLWLFAETAAETRDASLLRTATHLVDYLDRDLQAPDGLYFTAEDADSEGREGTFYVWTPAQLTDALGEEAAALMGRLYNVEPKGNFAEEATGHFTGENLLYLTAPLEDLAPRTAVPELFAREVRDVLGRLREVRARRVRPMRDEKIHADLNLMLATACLKSAKALAGWASAHDLSHRLRDMGLRLVETVADTFSRPDGLLAHRKYGQDIGLKAPSDAYAWGVMAAIEAFSATGNFRHAERARTWADVLLRDFYDPARGVFTTASRHANDLIAHPAERYDGATPSANAVALHGLDLLYGLTLDDRYRAAADRLVEAASEELADYPTGHSFWLLALDERMRGRTEIVLAVGEGGHDEAHAMQYVMAGYPAWTLSLNTSIPPEWKGLAAYEFPVSGVRAYVCRTFVCNAPVDTADALRQRLEALRAPH